MDPPERRQGRTDACACLAIVRSLVEQRGGTITIDSTPEEGTRITVHLPADLAASTPAPVAGE